MKHLHTMRGLIVLILIGCASPKKSTDQSQVAADEDLIHDLHYGTTLRLTPLSFHLNTALTGEHEKHVIIDSRSPALYSRFQFTGKSRRIADDTYRFLKIRFEGASDEAFLKAYGETKSEMTEVQFTQDNASYWFPVQKKVNVHLQKELKAHDEVILLLRYFGAIHKKHVYLVIEFEGDSEVDTHHLE